MATVEYPYTRLSTSITIPSGETYIIPWAKRARVPTVGIAAPDGDLSTGTGVDVEVCIDVDESYEDAIWYEWEMGIESRTVFAIDQYIYAIKVTNNTDDEIVCQIHQ